MDAFTPAPSFAQLNVALVREQTFVATIETFEELASTNDYARHTAGTAALPRLIVAARQSAGRGRAGRTWWTGAGSLAASLVIDPAALGISPPGLPQIALSTGAALVSAIRQFNPPQPLGLHWPNDVFLCGRKLAGLLCETLPRGEFVIGCGVNVNNSAADAPADVRDRIVTLRDATGAPLPPTEFVIALLLQQQAMLKLLAHSPATVAARCDELLLQRGKTLTVRCGGEDITGECLGIAADGALLLDTTGGRREVYSGSVLP